MFCSVFCWCRCIGIYCKFSAPEECLPPTCTSHVVLFKSLSSFVASSLFCFINTCLLARICLGVETLHVDVPGRSVSATKGNASFIVVSLSARESSIFT